MDASVSGRLSEVELSQRLRDAGLRVTRPRVTLLALLDELGGHHSADELCEVLEQRDIQLPRASVFNVIGDLVRHGLLMMADVGPGRALYEFKTQWHHHFVCRECGGIMDVPCAVGSKPCMDPGVPGLVADEAQVIFRGPCPQALVERPSGCVHTQAMPSL